MKNLLALTLTSFTLLAQISCGVSDGPSLLSKTSIAPPPGPLTLQNVTSSMSNGSFVTGSTISIQIVYSANVIVTGTPVLTLATGAATYSSGSGTNRLTFTYTVQAGDYSSTLDYASITALALAGGTITDSSGVNAPLVLPSPGAAGSLGANKSLIIDSRVLVMPLSDSVVITSPSSGAVLDSSGHAYHGTQSGGANTAAGGIVNRAGSFTGTSVVTIPAASWNNLSSGAISAWVQSSNINASTVIAKQWDGHNTLGVLSIGYYPTSGGLFQAGTNGKIYFHASNGNQFNSNSAIDSGWHHLVVNFSTTTASLYIDGVLDATASGDFSIPDVPAPTTTSMGAWPNNGLFQGGLNGLLDEMGIWNTNLTLTDISNLYNSGSGMHPQSLAAQSAHLIVAWNFDESTWLTGTPSTNAVDNSYFQTNGTASGLSAGAVASIAAHAGNGLLFDGTSGEISVRASNLPVGSSARTWSAWFKASSGNGGYLMSAGNYASTSNTASDFGVGINVNSAKIAINAGGPNVACYATVVDDGTWHHLAVVSAAGGSLNTVTLYVDGSAVSRSGPCSGSPLASALATESSGTFMIGGYNHGGTFFNGGIQTVTVWSRSLSASEMRSVYNGTVVY